MCKSASGPCPVVPGRDLRRPGKTPGPSGAAGQYPIRARRTAARRHIAHLRHASRSRTRIPELPDVLSSAAAYGTTPCPPRASHGVDRAPAGVLRLPVQGKVVAVLRGTWQALGRKTARSETPEPPPACTCCRHSAGAPFVQEPRRHDVETLAGPRRSSSSRAVGITSTRRSRVPRGAPTAACGVGQSCSSAAGAPPASDTAVPRSSNDSCRSSAPSFSEAEHPRRRTCSASVLGLKPRRKGLRRPACSPFPRQRGKPRRNHRRRRRSVLSMIGAPRASEWPKGQQ